MTLSPTTSRGGSSSSGTVVYFEEVTAAVVAAATADGNGNGTAFAVGASTAYTAVLHRFEFYSPFLSVLNATAQNVLVNLYDGTTDLGRMGNLSTPGNAAAFVSTCVAVTYLTPSAGNHTYNLKTWKTTAGATASVAGGLRGASTYLPGFLRISIA